MKIAILCIITAFAAAAFEDMRHKPETRYIVEETRVHDCSLNALALQVSETKALRSE